MPSLEPPDPAGPDQVAHVPGPGQGPPGRPPASARTVRLYAADWNSFVTWCRQAGATPLPADPGAIASYLSASAGRLGPGALARRAAAIAGEHRGRGVPSPTSAPAVKLVLARARATATPRRAPLAAKRLARMIAGCPGDLAGSRDRALLLLLESGLGRAALVGLDAEAIRFDTDGARIRVGDADLLVPRRPEIGRCPVRALQDWLDASETRFGAVFRKVDRWGNVAYGRLGADAVRRILARRTPRRALRPAKADR